MAEQIVTLGPGESEVVSFEITPSVAKVYQVAVNGLQGNFTAVPAAIGAQFIMLGGLVDRIWSLGKDVYIKHGTLKNVGDETGTTTVVGWWRAGNSPIYDAYQETITLAPGESRGISYSITRAEMDAAQVEGGHPYPYYEFLMAYISTFDHITYYTKYGHQCTRDTVQVMTA